ncbi:hypothetical protein [Paraflavitalea speifideaquila]|uniref:hypothetical protein n=1 Tax=Paraflavitalea speifideaquila TaxID=3076558 RepID=UPI0028E70569|nr:hypothetical protein [Paraflavitalea speifideiaquila]
MKKITGILLLCLGVVGTMAFVAVNSIFDQLDIAEAEAKESIFDNFRESKLTFPVTSVIKGMATGKRAGVVKELGDYIRKYTNSPAFAEEYKRYVQRKTQKPVNKEEKIQKQIAETKAEIAETEKELKTATADSKKLLEMALQLQKNMLKDLQDPNSLQYNYTVGIGEMTQAEFDAAMKVYEKEFPVNPQDMVKQRLQDFLALTADINFDAPLDSRKRFVDPKLEARDDNWKRCFRSGRETITAARVYAQQWLKELK